MTPRPRRLNPVQQEAIADAVEDAKTFAEKHVAELRWLCVETVLSNLEPSLHQAAEQKWADWVSSELAPQLSRKQGLGLG